MKTTRWDDLKHKVPLERRKELRELAVADADTRLAGLADSEKELESADANEAE